jgi:hypothetical protein
MAKRSRGSTEATDADLFDMEVEQEDEDDGLEGEEEEEEEEDEDGTEVRQRSCSPHHACIFSLHENRH